MKIGLCGTMSVGKTTLVKALAKTAEFKNYKTATERSKYLRDLGIPLNTDSTINGQFVFLAERSSELLHENILTDRTIWDVCSFTMLAKSIATHDKSQFVNAAMTLREQYDIVFYIEPVGVEMEDNGVRETNLEYRADINQEILRLLSLFPPKKLVILHGSTKDRVKTVLDTLK
jgi:deoxyadenosine/deoxycytidine kinase